MAKGKNKNVQVSVKRVNSVVQARLLQALIDKPRHALAHFQYGEPKPLDWNELRARIHVLIAIAEVFNVDGADLQQLGQNGLVVINAIATRYHVSDSTILKATAGEIVVLTDALDVVDDIQKSMTAKDLLEVYQRVQQTLNKE